MNEITLTPEVMGIIANIMLVVGGFIKLEKRLTKLETTQDLLLNGMISSKQIDRRRENANKKPAE